MSGTDPRSDDFRVRLRKPDDDAARRLAFNGGHYDQAEPLRLLRLALHEIDVLAADLERVTRELEDTHVWKRHFQQCSALETERAGRAEASLAAAREVIEWYADSPSEGIASRARAWLASQEGETT